jgi:hypothetical protein
MRSLEMSQRRPADRPIEPGDGRGETLARMRKLIHEADNSSLEGNTRRAIDIGAGEEVDTAAFKALVRAAIERNRAKAGRSSG